MGWSAPSNNTGILVAQGQNTFFVSGSALSTHDVIVVEPIFGNGSVVVEMVENISPRAYRVRIRVQGNILVRFHGEAVN